MSHNTVKPFKQQDILISPANVRQTVSKTEETLNEEKWSKEARSEVRSRGCHKFHTHKARNAKTDSSGIKLSYDNVSFIINWYVCAQKDTKHTDWSQQRLILKHFGGCLPWQQLTGV